MNTLQLIEEYYTRDSLSYRTLVAHGEVVAEKALAVAQKVDHLGPDLPFIREAAMLHDIGMFLTDAPSIGCHGDAAYICHGFLGRDLMERAGFPRHALVCESHIGVGITVAEIEDKRLPLPRREVEPRSLEERIICYADKFFSKNKATPPQEKTLDQVTSELKNYGIDQVDRFLVWHEQFS